MKPLQAALLTIILLFAGVAHVSAATVQMPEWYRMRLDLSEPPSLNRELSANVSLQAIIGNLEKVKIRLIVPEGWKVDAAEKQLAMVAAGQKAEVVFKVTPTGYLSQGSIIAEASLQVPFPALEGEIKRNFTDQAAAMIKTLHSWPAISQRYSEASFALLAEESFYPLGQGMWLNYAEKLAPGKNFRGPVFFDDSIITTHQAQTDVEMFEKLIAYGKADPELENRLIESGVDIKRKKSDQLNGLYVLATRLFIDGNHQEALNFLNRLETEIATIPDAQSENLEITALNLKGLIFWGMNQKRLAEDFLKKAFYRNRKNPLQRYVLRNIGLLMLSRGENATAQQMMRLGTSFKTGYTLLEQEYERVANP